MSNILVQFPEIQEAINNSGGGSIDIAPPRFRKSSAVELTELVKDSQGRIGLRHWGWGSNDMQKKNFATAFRLNSNFSRMGQWWTSSSNVFATIDAEVTFYYKTDQSIKNLGVIGNSSSNSGCYLISFNLNRYFYFGNYTASDYSKQVPILQKNGG